MARLRYNGASGSMAAGTLSSTSTTYQFSVAPPFATLAANQYIPLVLSPGAPNQEIVWLTAYTATQTSGTILRHQEGSSAQAHSPGDAAPEPDWLMGLTTWDLGSQDFQDSGGQVFNVKHPAYGAKGDGSTDDTTAIQAAINACSTAGGGTVLLPAGVFVVVQISLPSLVELAGAGEEVTILREKSGGNNTVLVSSNFGFNTGTNNTTSPNEFGIRDLTIDGNAGINGLPGSQTFGYGMQLYGYRYRLRNVSVRNCHNDGIWSEWANAAAAQTPNNVESSWSNVTVHDNGNNGITWEGPHDSRWADVVSYNNNNIGIRILGNGSALQAVNCHAWGNWQQGWSFESTLGAAYLSGCESEGSNSGATTPQVYINGQNDVTWVGGNIFCPRNGKVGVQVDGAASGSTFITKIANATSGGVVFTNDGGHGRWECRLYNCTPPYSGTPAATTRIHLPNSGGTATSNLGHLTSPAVPASTVAYTNTFGTDCTVFVTGGTVTAVAIGGTSTGLTSGSFRIPSGQTITLTYSAAPTWTWFGD